MNKTDILDTVKETFLFTDLVDLYVFEFRSKSSEKLFYVVIAENLEEAVAKLEKVSNCKAYGFGGATKEEGLQVGRVSKGYDIRIYPIIYLLTKSHE